MATILPRSALADNLPRMPDVPDSDHFHSRRSTAPPRSVDLMDLGLLLGRLCFAADFLLFGARKLSDPSIISKLLVAHHLPGDLVYAAMFLQLFGGACILLGLQTRFWSAAFAWFCIVAPSIFWLDDLENLTRDYAAAGGFLFLLLFGPGRLSLDAVLRGMPDPVVRYIPAITVNVVLIEWTMLVGRTLIALPFLADLVKKLIHFEPQRALLESKGIPGDAIAVIMLIELVFGLAILVGWRPRLAAAVLIALAIFNGFVLHFPSYVFAVFNDRFHELMLANFKNRGAATFFKDITTIGALLIFAMYAGRTSKVGPETIEAEARAD
ncbi:MAG: DoxX family protein [Reyranellaceae bacterium]